LVIGRTLANALSGAKVRALVTVGAAALVAGCGGGSGGDEKRAATTRGPPLPSEPLAAAATRLQRTLPGKECRALAPLMLHSVAQGLEPNATPTKAHCRSIRYEIDNVIGGFRLTKTSDFGAAGFTEGRGDKPRKGDVLGIVWARDKDGSWKVVYDAIFRPQVGLPPAYGAGAAANAQSFVSAVSGRNCDKIWRLLNVGSRFVRNNDGRKATFCKVIAPFYHDPKNTFAQIRADPGTLHRLGTTRDVSFFGLELRNGRYVALVLSGRLGGIADAEQRQHGNPSVLEFVTVRPPRG
jgi:hypothetical protein